MAMISFIFFPFIAAAAMPCLKDTVGGLAPPQGVVPYASRTLLQCVNGAVNNSHRGRNER